MSISTAVFGSGRTAASTRLLTVASRSWMADADVCPAPVHAHGVAGLTTLRFDELGPRAEGIGRAYDHLSAVQFTLSAVRFNRLNLSAVRFNRQFVRYDPGFPDLRPPV
ncbi:MAG TPA: hypothetical protein VI248_11655 [Kineosporiaceae bacterium]